MYWQPFAANFSVARAFMAEEFNEVNSAETILQFKHALDGVALEFEPHIDFKKRVPHASGSSGPVTPFNMRT